MKLYDIKYEILVLEHHMESAEAAGESVPEVWKKHLDELQLDRMLKIEGCEEESLKRRRQILENRAGWLTNYLIYNVSPTEKLISPRVELCWRKSESVEITDEFSIPDEYIKIIQESRIDKMAIKEKLKAGEEIPGAALVTKQNLTLK
jgi:rRNA maturation endonuclease Nob1